MPLAVRVSDNGGIHTKNKPSFTQKQNSTRLSLCLCFNTKEMLNQFLAESCLAGYPGDRQLLPIFGLGTIREATSGAATEQILACPSLVPTAICYSITMIPRISVTFPMIISCRF